MSVLCVCVRAKSLQSCQTLCNPMEVAHQTSLSLGFSRQEYWSGLPCPLPDPGTELCIFMSPALAGGLFTTSDTWDAVSTLCIILI